MLEKIALFTKQPKKIKAEAEQPAQVNALKSKLLINRGRKINQSFGIAPDDFAAFFDAIDSKKASGKPNVKRHCK